jgi:hypothetical protein
MLHRANAARLLGSVKGLTAGVDEDEDVDMDVDGCRAAVSGSPGPQTQSRLASSRQSRLHTVFVNAATRTQYSTVLYSTSILDCRCRLLPVAGSPTAGASQAIKRQQRGAARVPCLVPGGQNHGHLTARPPASTRLIGTSLRQSSTRPSGAQKQTRKIHSHATGLGVREGDA